MPARLRHIRGRSEEEAERAAARVDDAEPAPGGRSRGGAAVGDPALHDVRLHRDQTAAALTHALGAHAAAIGRDVYFAPNAPGLHTAAGRKLLVHELTHVVQQRQYGRAVQLFTAGERSLIAPDLAAMMAVIQTLVAASSTGDQVNMDKLVVNAGGATAMSALPKSLRSDGPTKNSSLTLRYLFTSRSGLLDMRHFIQLMYISWFLNAGNAGMAARGATKKGIEHEETSEPTSKFAPEDLTSNALGAWTATQLAGFPQKDDLVSAIRRTLELSGPVAFDKLSVASQDTVVNFYSAQSGVGEPLNQNTTAVALIPTIPELAGSDRSFPFDLDSDDSRRATIAGPAFAGGVAGLTGDSEIRDFVRVQRDEVLTGIIEAERVRLCIRLMKGWVADADIDAFERLYRSGDSSARVAIRRAIPANTLSGGQRTRLTVLYMGTP